jgi:glycosyltransferase involved in cell wall biosynthesis
MSTASFDGASTVVPVTLIVPTRNEALNIERCLQSAYGFIDQIYVVDSESIDDTRTLAGRYAEVVEFRYDHSRIIPWIYQWSLDNLAIRNEWVMILEADQCLTAELRAEMATLFARDRIEVDGFYVRRRQIFRGQELRFGGYGSKYMLKLFRRSRAELDPDETDTRVYVQGKVERLRSSVVEENKKEDEILFYLSKHLRYADVFAREELMRRKTGFRWKQDATLFGSPDQRLLWLKRVFFKLPLYVRPLLYFVYRYVVLLGFLDGKQGAIFHFLQAFWFRLVWDIRLEELLAKPSAPQGEGRSAAVGPG